MFCLCGFGTGTELSRLSQARQVFVSHPSDPLVDVIEVDQKELSVSLQLFLMSLCLGLGWKIKSAAVAILAANEIKHHDYRGTFSAII